jgi:hypothetical protein
MADNKNDLPKVPPFIIKGTSGKAAQEPASQPRPVSKPPERRNGQPSERGMLSVAILLISAISLGIALLSGAKFAYDILSYKPPDEANQGQSIENSDTAPTQEQATEESETPGKYEGAFSKVIVVGLAYLVGWFFTALGIRVLGNLMLPLIIKFYAWMTLSGLVVLQLAIISRLFEQAYKWDNFIRYLSLYSAGLLALVGLHLVLEKNSPVFYGIPILLTSLAHLFLTVFHFVFLPDVIYGKLWGDLVFFAVTTTVSVYMMARFGILKGSRRLVDRMFNPKDSRFIPME